MLALSLCGVIVLMGCASGGRAKTPGKQMKQPKPPPAYPAAVATPIDPELRAEARRVISEDLVAEDPILRAHAVEAIGKTIHAAGEAQVLKALDDPEPVVQFSAAMVAGDLRLAAAHARLLKLADEPNRHVRVAARYALHRLGDTHLSAELEKLAQDFDPHVRADVAMVLGRLEEPSAVNVLRPMLADPKATVRLQAAEALWRLHDHLGLETLVAFSVSAHPDDQIVATLALAEPRDQRVRQSVRSSLVSDYAELSLVAARAMGMLNSDEGYGVALIGADSSDARQRALAALAFGAIGRADAQPILAKLLKDSDAEVQLAAATALLQLRDE